MAAQDQGLERGLSVYEREKEEPSQSTQLSSLSLAPLAEQMVLQQPEAPEPLLVDQPC